MRTEVHLPLLDQVRIASPCPVRWEDMTGDDVERHCAQCNLSVFNLSNMTRTEAEAVLRRKVENPEQRLCAGFYRRADGTILLKDCPVGLRAARVRVAQIGRSIAAAIGLLVFGGYAAAGSRSEPWRAWGWSMKLRELQPFKAVSQWLAPPAAQRLFLAGDICLPEPPSNIPEGKMQFGPRPEF